MINQMIFRWGLLWMMLVVFPFGAAVAQDEDSEACEMTTNKKALKLYEKGIDRKKYNYQERVTFLREAVETDEDFTLALWKLTQMRVKDAILRRKPYLNQEDELLDVVENCPEVHSAPYFYLAEIYMQRGDFQQAYEFYNKFLDFASDDDSKFDRKYDEQLEKAQANVKISKFLADQYANPQVFNPVKLLPVSTDEADEYLPFLSPDNKYLYFTRRFKERENSRETYIKSDRISYVERFSVATAEDGRFDKGEALPAPFNADKKNNYGGATLTQDNKEMYFTMCEQRGDYINCDIFYTQYVFSAEKPDEDPYWHWTDPERLDERINTEDGWESQPTISKDGKWLMFATIRQGTRGIDIYQAFRNEDGEFSQAASIGKPVNTAGNDKSPFFHSDSRTLYFASDGHLGLGGYDVFLSKLQDDSTWSEPRNLGYPINSDYDEHGYVVSLDGKTAYFGSASPYGDKKNKTLDIYHFDLPENVRPDKVLLVQGDVKTVDGEVPADAVVELRNTKTLKLETVKVDRITGSYSAIVNIRDSADYMMTVKGTNVAFNNTLIEVPVEEEAPIVQKIDVAVKELKKGAHITIDNVHFKTNSSELSEKSRASLNALVAYLKENPEVHISIEGHTDNVGEAKANMALSADRAYSVLSYIQHKGIDSSRLRFKGWGETRPIAPNDTPEGRAMNRRIEIVILDL